MQIYDLNAAKEYNHDLISLLKENELPVQDIDVAGAIRFFIALDDDKLIACAGIEPYGEVALLRSFAVRQEHRSQQVGRRLLEHVLRHCRSCDIDKVFLLTTTAERYFLKFGFKVLSREDVPLPIRNSREFLDICPASAVVMFRELN